MLPNPDQSATRRITRRDWLTGLGASLTLAGLPACERPNHNRNPKPKSPFAGQPAPERPNIVVILADTLRADHLRCYGYQASTSPLFDGLARFGVLFERYFSCSTWTKPALGSVLTGVPARVHQAVASSGWQGVLDLSNYRVQALRSAFETLPQALKKVGYATAYLQSNAHGRPEFGYGRGFDFTRIRGHYPAHLQVTDALEWLTNQPHQPFFLFIHEIDPHGPYVAKDSFFKQLHGISSQAALETLDPAEGRRVQRYVDLMDAAPKAAQGVQGISEEANRYIQMRYDAEIYQINMRFKRLLTFLERAGISEHTLVAITSDHGEAFGEKGYYGHGHSLPYDELVHIPLIMAGAGLPRNVRVPHTTSMIDFYPTLLELAGAEPPSYIPGSPMFASNRELLVDADRIAYVDLDKKMPEFADWDAAIVKGNYKVATHDNGATHWIFDRAADPGENDNLAHTGRLPEDVERGLIAELQAHVQRYEELSRAFGEPEWMEAHDGHVENLKALGYI